LLAQAFSPSRSVKKKKKKKKKREKKRIFFSNKFGATLSGIARYNLFYP
jgi:hypothetical protein